MVMREIGCSMRRTSYPKNLVTEKAKIEMFEFRNTVTDSAKSVGRKLKNEMQKNDGGYYPVDTQNTTQDTIQILSFRMPFSTPFRMALVMRI